MDSGLGMDILKIVLGRDLGEKGGNAGGGVNGTGTGSGSTKGKESADSVTSEKKEEDEDAMQVVGDGDDEMKSLKVVKGLGEDRRVIGAALAAVCNILTDFSPLRPVKSFSFLVFEKKD